MAYDNRRGRSPFSGSRYVSQYVGNNNQTYNMVANNLQRKYDNNLATMDKLSFLAASPDMLQSDLAANEEYVNRIRKFTEDMSKTGDNYHMVGDHIRQLAKEYSLDPILQNARKQKKVADSLIESSKDLSQAQKLKVSRAISKYNETGSMLDEEGKLTSIEGVDFYEDVNIQDSVDDFYKGWEETNYPNGLEGASEDDLYNAGNVFLRSGSLNRQLEDEVKLDYFKTTGQHYTYDEGSDKELLFKKLYDNKVRTYLYPYVEKNDHLNPTENSTDDSNTTVSNLGAVVLDGSSINNPVSKINNTEEFEQIKNKVNSILDIPDEERTRADLRFLSEYQKDVEEIQSNSSSTSYSNGIPDEIAFMRKSPSHTSKTSTRDAIREYNSKQHSTKVMSFSEGGGEILSGKIVSHLRNTGVSVYDESGKYLEDNTLQENDFYISGIASIDGSGDKYFQVHLRKKDRDDSKYHEDNKKNAVDYTNVYYVKENEVTQPIMNGLIRDLYNSSIDDKTKAFLKPTFSHMENQINDMDNNQTMPIKDIYKGGEVGKITKIVQEDGNNDIPYYTLTDASGNQITNSGGEARYFTESEVLPITEIVLQADLRKSLEGNFKENLSKLNLDERVSVKPTNGITDNPMAYVTKIKEEDGSITYTLEFTGKNIDPIKYRNREDLVEHLVRLNIVENGYERVYTKDQLKKEQSLISKFTVNEDPYILNQNQ